MKILPGEIFLRPTTDGRNTRAWSWKIEVAGIMLESSKFFATKIEACEDRDAVISFLRAEELHDA